MEILENLAASATCARIASATVDYITNEKLREWFLGIESHSLGEPWPDILGVSIIIVVVGLFMLGLEKSQIFTALLLVAVLATFTFFISVGCVQSVINLTKWSEDFKTSTIQSVREEIRGKNGVNCVCFRFYQRLQCVHMASIARFQKWEDIKLFKFWQWLSFRYFCTVLQQ